MELSVVQHPELVIALDIGSTYSGYAWQSRAEFETNRNDIHYNTNWGAGAIQLHKTQTCLLIKMKPIAQRGDRSDQSTFNIDLDDIEKVRIGHEAENVYINLTKANSDAELYLFKKFKLLLYNMTFHEEQQVEDQVGKHLPFADVMMLFIKALKDHCLEKIQRSGVSVNMKKTLFVVTVPAIWRDDAKNFMRNAAINAGIDKRNVLLALEPEAAAISCMHLPQQNKAELKNFDEVGQKFLVADLGGGTADLTAVEVVETGYLKELLEPSGGLIGGQNINEAFFQVCHDSFEGDAWKQYFSESVPVSMLRMEADFEQKKVTIGSTDSDVNMMDITMPHQLKESVSSKRITLKPGAGLIYRDDEFLFDSRFVKEKLFHTTCKSVFDIIRTVLVKPQAEGLGTVILVGGFAESPVVVEQIRKMIKEEFGDVLQVFVPFSPFKSVLQGAVIYGHDPMIFTSRISRWTYGVATNSKFDESEHDESKKWKNEEDGIYRCKDIFHVHVTKGQSVRLSDKQPVRTYNPIKKEQTAQRLLIFASPSPKPKYTTDDGCKKIAEINVEMPDTTGGTGRKVEVQMIYGGTQLSVIAKDVTTGKEFDANINF